MLVLTGEDVTGAAGVDEVEGTTTWTGGWEKVVEEGAAGADVDADEGRTMADEDAGGVTGLEPPLPPRPVMAPVFWVPLV